MSVPVYRHMMGSANQINVTSVYRHTVCNCERASLPIVPVLIEKGLGVRRI